MKLRDLILAVIHIEPHRTHSKTFRPRKRNNARDSCSLVHTIIFPVAHYVNSFLSVVRANSVFPFRASFSSCRALLSLMLFCVPFMARSRSGTRFTRRRGDRNHREYCVSANFRAFPPANRHFKGLTWRSVARKYFYHLTFHRSAYALNFVCTRYPTNWQMHISVIIMHIVIRWFVVMRCVLWRMLIVKNIR